jgi:hypothetical protein
MLSGCFGNTDSNDTPVEEEITPVPYSIQASWNEESIVGQIGEISELTILLVTTGEGSYETESVITRDGQSIDDTSWSVNEKPTHISVVLLPNTPGNYLLEISIKPSEGDSIIMTNSVKVDAPDEGSISLITPQYLVAESSVMIFEGQVLHQSIESCDLGLKIPNEEGTIDLYDISLQDDGTFSFILTDLDLRTESFVITGSASCGIYSTVDQTRNTTILIEVNNDADGDGIEDQFDNCPDGLGEADGWASSSASDADQDGCRDYDEDLDDDNDGILDSQDGCSSTIGWISTAENDRDRDGCNDVTEDSDDDGDGILDVNDECLNGEINWPANLYNDWDQDGCNDLLEDNDDDNDGENDTSDLCPKGRSNWMSERNALTDFDMDGCFDSTEDSDDDNDNVNDVNATGATLDMCPTTPLGATDVDEFGCAAIERDTDEDGVNDLLDQCEGTPNGLQVNSAGCADLDGDGVFANVDICADSPTHWTIDSDGCAIVQKPIQWTS